MHKRIFLLLLTVFCFSCKEKTAPKPLSTISITTDSLTTALTGLAEKGTIQGFGVAIVNQDSTLYAKGYGIAKREEATPYTENTLQNIASISKTLIGVALLKAQEMDKLNMDDPIDQYLPFDIANPFYPEEAITIRHLATHTSTIQDGDLYSEKSYVLENSEDIALAKSFGGSEAFNLPDAEIPMGEFLENFLATNGAWYTTSSYLRTKPGKRYEYTNVGATLAAYIIERATAQSYADFTTQYILKPLGTDASGWTATAIDSTQRTDLFTVEGKKIPNYKLVTYPDGGLITSVDDMAKFLSELIRGYSGLGTLLSAASYQELFTAFLTAANFEEERDTDRPYDDEYNSGLFMGHTPIGHIGHMGGDPGVSTFMFFNPETKIGRLLFVNTDLDAKGAEQFYAIWEQLGAFEQALNTNKGTVK